MSIILKKMALPKESKLWLFECGECHSEFLLRKEDFVTGNPQNEDVIYTCNCPVCGEPSGILNEDWVENGNIKDIKRYNYDETIVVTDYDCATYTYKFKESEDYISARDAIGEEVFEHYRVLRDRYD